MTQNQNEEVANNVDEDGKLFVGGLSWETSQEKLQEYFAKYGEVVDCVVMKNKETGRSRGFGFITFKDSKCVAKVLSISPHELDGRTIDPKVCSTRGAHKVKEAKKDSSYPKVFLGGLPANCTETDIRAFFSRYGNVMEVVLMYDQEKKKARGFGFLSFETEDSVKRVCAEHYIQINGKQVECKQAEPRDKRIAQQQMPQNQWGTPNMGGWGPPPPGGPMGPTGPAMGPGGPMPGPMTGPYQGGWGGPQPGPYGPQGGWGPQQPGYGPGYQNWGPGWGGPPQYGQGYGYGPGYGGSYGSYNGPPAPGPGGPPAGAPPTGDGYGGPATTTGPGGPASGQGPPGASTYAQESSSYGPARGTYGGNSTNSTGYSNSTGSYGPSTAYNTSGSYGQGNYAAAGDSTAVAAASRVGSQSQTGYHPYRR